MGAAAAPLFAAIGAAAAGYGAAQILAVFVVNLALTGLSMALAGKRKRDLRQPIQVMVRSTIEFRRIVLGKQRCHGALVYYRTSSPNSDEVNKYLWYVVVFAGHQCNSITDIWIDKVHIADAQIDPGTGEVSQAHLNGKMYIWKYLGTSAQTADPNITAAIPSEWTSDHRLQGNTYIVIRMERDDDAYPNGAPQDVSALIEGALCYDPREGGHDPDDPSTWEYTENPILHARWLLTGGSVINDDTTRLIRYGLKESDDRIDDTYTIAAANVCDASVNIPDSGTEPRFKCGIELSCGESREEQLLLVLATCAGQAIYIRKWRLYAAAYETPTHALTDADIRGPIEIDDIGDIEERYNQTTAVYFNALDEYVESTSPLHTDEDYEEQDGEPLLKELDLRGVTSVFQAERLCNFALQQSRNMRTIQFPGGFDLMKIAPWETFTLSNTRLGWTNRVFRLLSRQLVFDEANGVITPKLVARQESSAAYADLDPGDYIGDSSTSSGGRDVSPPGPAESLTTYGQTDGILVTWDGTLGPTGLFELYESTASNMAGQTRVYYGQNNSVLLPKVDTTTYYYRVRTVRSGIPSAYAPSTGSVAGAASSISGGFRATADPGSLFKSGTTAGNTTASTTVTAVNGTPAYTYAWTWASGGSGITIDSPSAATTTFSATGLSVSETRSGTARCTVTDSAAASVTADVNVSIRRVDFS